MTPRPIYIVSHYAENRGTTDYLVDFLLKKQAEFFYLRHPLPESHESCSELIHSRNGSTSIMRSYKTPSNFLVKMLKELLLNVLVLCELKLRYRIRYMVGFGAVNVLGAPFAKLLSIKTIFWGVDYSRKRFSSALLNSMYALFETIACMTAFRVVQPTIMQRDQRVEKHHLSPRKAIIIPNGVNPMGRTMKKAHTKFCLIYIGSLSRQHGMLEFIKKIYVRTEMLPLDIFGSGSEFDSISSLVRSRRLKNVTLHGSVSPETIAAFIAECKLRPIGLAPYRAVSGGHAQFGDSLKIKEYVNLGLPYIASDVIRIEQDLKAFGLVYASAEELTSILNHTAKIPDFSNEARNAVVHKYSWDRLMSDGFAPLVELA